MIVAAEEKAEADYNNVVAWRYAQLRRAGVDTGNAQIVAGRIDISLHDALELLEHKCPPSLMVAILI